MVRFVKLTAGLMKAQEVCATLVTHLAVRTLTSSSKIQS